MLRIKKVLLSIMCIFAISLSIFNVTYAEGETLQIGDYIQMGTYNDIPIIWRYVVDDEYGKLLVSDKILCKKIFRSSFSNWCDSYIRSWLNSYDILFWSYKGKIYKPYGDELSFLSNFTREQINLMNPTTQWTMVNDMSLSENGADSFYSIIKKHKNP